MVKTDQIQEIEKSGIIAIVRFDRPDELVNVASALAEGGIKVIEFTMTIPGATKLLEEASKELADNILLGAGTVLDGATARAAILSGAQFIVSPNLKPEVIEICRRYSITAIPGALTPTEILTAWECGADFVKLFPAEIGGPSYLKSIKAPLPHIKLIPVGGVSLDNIPQYIQTGASAVAVGSNLVNKRLIKEKRFDQLVEVAKQYVKTLQTARSL
ncbi:MAG: bifunctional 4-hydroxy-2-oxoglutarate aldolase/2-dehydro-3-deoxy-phosphogluconate aldolase [Anaerolineales bacterium]|nr:bifunctional 4-hydroxy-2-oxoglutarate aldolase/2-dehydro-3-deoxy-phosphogluconate aldolase [Anaerolineales bacterium]